MTDYQSLSILVVSGHWGYFSLLAIVSNAAANLFKYDFWCKYIFVFLLSIHTDRCRISGLVCAQLQF